MAATETRLPFTSDAVAQQLDALFSPWNRTDAPGLVVGMSRAGKPLYRRGFGMASLEFGIAASPATRMRIGSTSKHFACLLALLLAEDGKLSLDAPIRTYIPELIGPGGEPTLRQLMQHRGGSRCYLDIGFLTHGTSAPSKGYALATQVRQTGRNFLPGEAALYNNGGYHLVSLAIERVGGAPFERQLTDRLFQPLGMTDTALVRSDRAITPGLATLHVPSPDGGWRRGLFPSDELLGEGGIVSTIDDMLRWGAHLRSRDKFGSPRSWTELMTPPTHPDGTAADYALGLMLHDYRGLKTIHHPGGVAGGSSEMVIVPEQALDIVILANGAPEANPLRLAERVIDIVLADLVGDPVSKVAVSDYGALVGDWSSPDTGMLYSLTDVDGTLQLEMCKAASLALPLVRNGGEVIAQSNTGKITVDLDRALGTGELVISVCGRATAYSRSAKIVPAPSVFAEAVVGRFHSVDAAADLTISRLGDRLAVRISDGFGVVECDLICMGERFACTYAPPPAAWHWAALQFDIVEGVATGFRLNSLRTRNLEFKRI